MSCWFKVIVNHKLSVKNINKKQFREEEKK